MWAPLGTLFPHIFPRGLYFNSFPGMYSRNKAGLYVLFSPMRNYLIVWILLRNACSSSWKHLYLSSSSSTFWNSSRNAQFLKKKDELSAISLVHLWSRVLVGRPDLCWGTGSWITSPFSSVQFIVNCTEVQWNDFCANQSLERPYMITTESSTCTNTG